MKDSILNISEGKWDSYNFFFLQLRVSILRVLRLLIMKKQTAKISRCNSGNQPIHDNI